MSDGCQIPLSSGDVCDITSWGRCRICGKAFCKTHRARVGETLLAPAEAGYFVGSGYPDWCSECRTAELVAPILERQKKTAAAEAEQRRARQERRKKALAALHAHGFERLATSRTETWQVWEKRTFRRQRLHERSRVLDSAVLLGNLR